MEGSAIAEFVEKRSRFIGEIRPVSSEADFAAFLAEKRAEHRDARHNCSAFILRGGITQRYSDDGEPQGTAGVPMLEVLRREGLEDCAVIVTRYFGGILLGAGGLVRAYTHTAKLAVDAASRVEVCRCEDFTAAVAYALYDRVSLLLRDCGALTLDTDFGGEVTIRARLKSADVADFSARLTELTSGAVSICDTEEVFAPMPEASRNPGSKGATP